MMKSTAKKTENNRITEYLKKLEARIERLEEYLDITTMEAEKESIGKEKTPPSSGETSDILEFQIGQYWFARFGIVVLAIGIVFLLTLHYQNLPPAFPSMLGYVLVGSIFLLSHLLRKSYQYISRYLVGGGLLLLYFSTLRLHYFSIQPAVSNKSLELALLILIVIINLYISARRKSIYLASVNLTLGYVTAIVSGSTYFLFTVVLIMSIVVVYFKLRFHWHNLIFYGILLSNFTHLTWFTNNPFLGNELQLVSEPSINVIFLLIYAVIFAMGSFFRQRDLPENDILIASTLLNCLSFYVLYLLITITTLKTQLPTFHAIASLTFLIISIAFWIREKSKYSTFFYAILGYIALSVAIMGYFQRPTYFIWLCWQSLLVIITALWFRSKIIIVANFLIYLIVALSYLIFAKELGVVSISFGVVALLSARTMNWQKHRLEIKTELMRNSYLSVAFIMFPYTLYHSIPVGYISLSWVAVAIFYYIISRILNNTKYRWMALFTLLLTVIYLFIIGIAKLEPTYRIISFIVLGLVMLAVSIAYAKIKAKSSS